MTRPWTRCGITSEVRSAADQVRGSLIPKPARGASAATMASTPGSAPPSRPGSRARLGGPATRRRPYRLPRRSRRSPPDREPVVLVGGVRERNPHPVGDGVHEGFLGHCWRAGLAEPCRHSPRHSGRWPPQPRRAAGFGTCSTQSPPVPRRNSDRHRTTRIADGVRLSGRGLSAPVGARAQSRARPVGGRSSAQRTVARRRAGRPAEHRGVRQKPRQTLSKAACSMPRFCRSPSSSSSASLTAPSTIVTE